ncbi:MAG: SusC/RagA family TonB-linked outer membrane protein, partial [Bacteroidales bacterium]|nr:SusC/RagA family TonB-linked outer membrane protein [Bacteroidales bacterium]
MKRLIIFILIGLPISLGAQTVTVKGTVIDIDTRESIPGVNIINMSTQKGAISDLYGAYTLFEVEIGTVLRFSSIGYDFEEYTVKDDSRINVELISAITELDEIVIVGYGAMKKSDLTGSLSSINRDQIEHTENLTIEETLQGRVPGLQVSGGDGLLGSATSIFIRGVGSVNANTQPLFVVDGFPIEYEYDKEKTILDEEDPLNPLVNINPDDIASIEVLKDASATAIYGARGANGVILITTKKGESGKTNITLASKWSMNQPVKRLDMLGTPDYAFYMHEKSPNDEYWMEPETFVDSVNTDWQDVVYQNNLAVSQTYDLAIDGGSETTTFRSNLNYSTNSGVVKNTSLDRYSGSIKMNHKAGRWMEMFMDVNLASTKNNSTATGGTGGVPRGFGSVLNALMTPPTKTVDFEVTPEELDDEEDIEGGYTNPLTYLYSVKNTKKNTDLRMNTQMLFKITPSLTIMTRGGYRMGFAERNQYYPSNTGKGKNTNGIGIISGNNKTTLLGESTITYITSINDVHNINAVFGVSYTKTTDYAYDAENTEFGYSDLGFNNLGVGTEANLPGSWYYETSLQSNLGRFNYNYDGRYLATFSYRVDGSSKFGEGNKYAYFPSAAIAWRASEEGFFNDMEWLDNLKIRSSYGVTGNQGIPPYLSKDNYGVSNYVFDNTTISGVQVLNVADPNLKWETSQMIDAGIDFAAFNQRLVMTFDIYHKVTNDMLLAINVPAQSGFLTDWANIGSLLNKGFEASINF